MPDRVSSTTTYAQRFSGAVGRWMLNVQLETVLGMLGDLTGRTILDVGGGHGQLARPLGRRGYDVTVLGTSQECAERIREDVDVGRIKFEVGTPHRLPCADNSFDVVISLRMLTHVEDWRAFVGELARVARASIVVDYPSKRSINAVAPMLFWAKKKIESDTRVWRNFSTRVVRDALRDSGFHSRCARRQFFFPMAAHRAMRCCWLSRGLERACGVAGLKAIFGSPILERFDACSLSLDRERTRRAWSGGVALSGSAHKCPQAS